MHSILFNKQGKGLSWTTSFSDRTTLRHLYTNNIGQAILHFPALSTERLADFALHHYIVRGDSHEFAKFISAVVSVRKPNVSLVCGRA